MKFIERFRRPGQEQETQEVQSDPLARRIDFETHKLKFYPGFDSFAKAWNEYVESGERKSLRGWVKELEGVELVANESYDLQGEYLKTIQAATERLSSGNLSKAEAKSLRRIRRRATEKISRLDVEEVEETTPDTLAIRTEKLRDADREFVIGLSDANACEFYALEFYREDQQEIDKIFIERVIRDEDRNQVKKELELWGLNFGLNSKIRTFYNTSDGSLEKPEFDAKVTSDTRRQAMSAFGSYTSNV